MSRRRIKVIHTSDVHLESDTFGRSEEGQKYRRRIQGAFQKVVDQVIAEDADLFLIAGDLFDSNRVHESGIEFVHQELSRAPCPVVLIPGNHDCYDTRSIYKKFDFSVAGPHVFTLTAEEGQVIELPHIDATVWGKGMIEHDHKYRPIAGVAPRHRDYWHIGMAHGYCVDEEELQRSSLIFPREIEQSGLDYLALGHVHVYTDLSQGETKACYPGTPAPLHLGVNEGGSYALAIFDPDTGVSFTQRKITLK
ncbi:MAG: DNA repair exonuclease [Deltaproteobacteria bacterium]|nr:DNA repair exonuclease [Deltaproteobacteria bacterium]